MYSRLLVPLDGSERAERALPVAATISRATGATVVLLRVIDLSRDIGVWGRVPAHALETMVSDIRVASQAYLGERANDSALQGLPVETIVDVGNATECVLDAAESRRVDLIVLCSHGRTGLARWALGSVAEHVARHAAVPVFLLRTASGPAFAGRPPDSEHRLRVLVPLDGSPLAEAALEPAAALVQALSSPSTATLHLATVLPPFAADPANMPDALTIEGAKSYLERTARQVRERHRSMVVTWSIAVELDFASGLIRVAENGQDTEDAGLLGGCDLIAMATHGTTGIQRWALGSITDRVLHATKLPILVVHLPQGAPHAA
jgi:nucleotide-binding universal stress UspA family protein